MMIDVYGNDDCYDGSAFSSIFEGIGMGLLLMNAF